VLIKSGTQKAVKQQKEKPMQQFEWIHAAWLALAIVLEILANVF
jgi:hypothetical protein